MACILLFFCAVRVCGADPITTVEEYKTFSLRSIRGSSPDKYLNLVSQKVVIWDWSSGFAFGSEV